MKQVLAFCLVVGFSLPAFASDSDVLQGLNEHYAGNPKYAWCLHDLNSVKPVSLPVAFQNAIKAAAYAEGVTACGTGFDGQKHIAHYGDCTFEEFKNSCEMGGGDAGPDYCLCP